VYQLAEDLFAQLQRRSLLFHSRNRIGDSLSRITGDSWCVYKIVDSLLFTPGYALVVTVGMLTLMAKLDAGLTAIAIAVAPVMAAVSFALGQPIRRAARARRESESLVQSQVQRALSGIHVVQAFAQEDQEEARFERSTRTALESQRRVTLVSALYNLASGLIMTVGTGAVLWFGARHVISGQLSLGSLMLFLAYLTMLQGQLKSLLTLYSTMQEVGAGVDRVIDILDVEPEVRDDPGAIVLPKTRGQIVLENVRFGYEPDRPVLRGISLDVNAGQTLALVGSTGAGKTTLVSLVPRFFDPWSGRVLLDGHDVRQVKLKSLREQIAIVPQEAFLFPVSIAENIAYGRPDAAQPEIEAAAKAANLHNFIQRLPHGYATIVGERGMTLSGGERQRLSIARALLKDAPILILDEPTSALDVETEKLLLDALQRLMAERTTLLIAHRLSTVRHADRIVVLKDGHIAETGTHRKLLEQAGDYAHWHRIQSGTQSAPVCTAG